LKRLWFHVSANVQKNLKKSLTPRDALEIFGAHTETHNQTIHMRTKVLLLTAAISAATVASSVAQVYSVNTVGYYTLTLPQGFSMIANQFNNGDNNLNTILPLPDTLVGAQMLKWDSRAAGQGGQKFLPSDDFNGSAFGGWTDANFAPTSTTLSPGEGAFINLPTATTLTLVGDVPEGALTVDIPPQFSIISQMVPQSIAVNENGLGAEAIPASIGDQILFWDNQTQGFKPSVDYNGPAFGGWTDANFSPVDPTPGVGESFFYNSGAASTVQWTRNFTVN
jgi:hypothetical protein